MAHEYYAVVLEFAPRYIRLGFAGEALPHIEIGPRSSYWIAPRSDAFLPAYLEAQSHALEPEQQKHVLEAIESELQHVCKAFRLDAEDNWANWNSDKYISLARTIKQLLVNKLLVSPNAVKLFVVDSGLAAVHKHDLCQAMLRDVVSLCFIPRSPCSAIAANVEDAVVVHVGWEESTTVVLGDLRCVFVETSVDYLQEAIHYKLLEKTQQAGFDATETLIRKTSLDVQDNGLLSLVEGLAQNVSSIISKQPIDMRLSLAQNLVITGQLSDIPGFKTRLAQEAQRRLPRSSVKVKKCLGSWAGASLYCSTTLLRHDRTKWRHMEITKEKLADSWTELQEQNY